MRCMGLCSFAQVQIEELVLDRVVVLRPHHEVEHSAREVAWDLGCVDLADALCAIEPPVNDSCAGAFVASLAENLSEDWSLRLMARGIAPLHGIDVALAAADAALSIGKAWVEPEQAAPIVGPLPAAAATRLVDEAEAKAMLAAAGVPVPQGQKVDADANLDTLPYPLAVKALGLAHKTEAGGVELNIADPAALRQSIARLAPLGTGVFAEEMVTGGIAELMVGVTQDPVLGPVLTIATGGTLVELLQDSATLLLPATDTEIRTALSGLRLYPLLTGFRGRPSADIDGVVTAISAIAGFAGHHAAELIELDINPLIITADHACAADALLVLRDA